METENPTPAVENNTNPTPIVPRSDDDLGNVASLACDAWHNNAFITLVYMTQPEFKVIKDEFIATLGLRHSTGAGRPEFTNKLGQDDKDITYGASQIKTYLAYKYKKKNAPSYYAQFGIVKVKGKFIIPADRDTRKAALELIIPAITLHGFDDEECGHDYWTDIQTRYNSDLQKAGAIDGSVSEKVADKNVLKKQIRKVLNSLIKVIQGNYPDTYKGVLRNWGFQKEKY